MSTEKRERKPQDPEITVLKACMRQLDTLHFVARARVGRYLAEYATDVRHTPLPTEQNGAAQEARDPFE